MHHLPRLPCPSIRRQIQKNDYKFFELDKFVQHFMLICHNCMEFNNSCVVWTPPVVHTAAAAAAAAAAAVQQHLCCAVLCGLLRTDCVSLRQVPLTRWFHPRPPAWFWFWSSSSRLILLIVIARCPMPRRPSAHLRLRRPPNKGFFNFAEKFLAQGMTIIEPIMKAREGNESESETIESYTRQRDRHRGIGGADGRAGVGGGGDCGAASKAP
jgi:hypothetical protein